MLGIFGPCFGDDIAGSLKCRVFIGDIECGVFEASEYIEWFLLQWLLSEEQFGEWLQATFASHGGAGAFFGFEGEVEFFEAALVGAGQDLILEFRGQFALFEDGFEDGVSACGQFAGGGQGIFDVAQLSFIEATGGFFAVACDEGDGVAVFEESGGAVSPAGADAESGGHLLAKCLQVERRLRGSGGLRRNCSGGWLRHGGLWNAVDRT